MERKLRGVMKRSGKRIKRNEGEKKRRMIG